MKAKHTTALRLACFKTWVVHLSWPINQVPNLQHLVNNLNKSLKLSQHLILTWILIFFSKCREVLQRNLVIWLTSQNSVHQVQAALLSTKLLRKIVKFEQFKKTIKENLTKADSFHNSETDQVNDLKILSWPMNSGFLAT